MGRELELMGAQVAARRAREEALLEALERGFSQPPNLPLLPGEPAQPGGGQVTNRPQLLSEGATPLSPPPPPPPHTRRLAALVPVNSSAPPPSTSYTIAGSAEEALAALRSLATSSSVFVTALPLPVATRRPPPAPPSKI